MGMKLTESNARAAVGIMKILAENKCTVADMPGILSYVETEIRSETTVPCLDCETLLQKLISDLED